jgi:type II secretion system protein G
VGLPQNFLRDANRNLGINLPETDEFLQGLEGMIVEAYLGSSQATVSAALSCREAKIAEDVRKILDAAQVVLRNVLKQKTGAPREVGDLVDAINFSTSNATVKGNLQASLDPLVKWIKDEMAGPNRSRISPHSMANAAKLQISLLETAVQVYHLDVGSYPSSLDALLQPPGDAAAKWNGPYVQKRQNIIDPWGTPYEYACPGQHGKDYDIWTKVPDGKVISSWE